jgi:DnaJ-like protein
MIQAPMFASLNHCSSLAVNKTLVTSPGLCVGDLYQVLGVRSGASDEEIRVAFRRLAKQLHPDLHPGDEEIERRFRDVLTAYETFKYARRAYRTSVALRRKRFRNQATTALAVFTLTVSVGLMFWRELSGALQLTLEVPARGSVEGVVAVKSDKIEPAPPSTDHSRAPELVIDSLPQPTSAKAPKLPPDARSERDDKGRVPTFNVLDEPEMPSPPSLLLLPGEYPEPPTGKPTPKEVSVSPANLPALAQNWARYADVRLGFALEYPADVFVSDQPEAGNIFRSRDRRARLIIISGAPQIGDVTLTKLRRFLLEGPYKDADLRYAPQHRTWFVLSGTLGSDMFYERITFTCNGRAFHGWKLEYPSTEQAFYEPIVEEIDRRYRHSKIMGGRCG